MYTMRVISPYRLTGVHHRDEAMYQQRTPVENPYCPVQHASGPQIEETTWAAGRGQCPSCGRYVNLRKNGTAKIHRTYGRREMARRVAEFKRTGA